MAGSSRVRRDPTLDRVAAELVTVDLEPVVGVHEVLRRGGTVAVDHREAGLDAVPVGDAGARRRLTQLYRRLEGPALQVIGHREPLQGGGHGLDRRVLDVGGRERAHPRTVPRRGVDDRP